MRIAVYNRWLRTAGGGERHGCAIAVALSQHHNVTLLTHQPVDLAWLGTRLGLDLSRIQLKLVPDAPQGRCVAAESARYDLFINTSHGDLLAACARRNALLVFFPAALPAPQPQLALLTLGAGFYPPEQADDEAFCWSDGVGELHLLPTPIGTRLRLCIRAPLAATVASLRDTQGLLLDQHPLPTGQKLVWEIKLPDHICHYGGRLRLINPALVPAESGRGDDRRLLGLQLLGAAVDLAGSAATSARYWLAHAAQQLTALPHAGQPWKVSLPTAHYPTPWAGLAAYDLLLANSAYTQQWILRRWGRSSHVLYPPVAVEQFVPAAKQPTILNVGRFFTGLHSKGQLDLVRSFARLCDGGLSGWTLRLVGGIDPGAAEHIDYLAQIRACAEGYPIKIETNVSPERLRALYAGSTLYWHAAGLGASPQHEPERCEHFGISLVEALAAGCVPLAYGCGGPDEIIKPLQANLLWYEPAALEHITLELVGDPARRARLAEAARARSRDFGWQPFEQTVAQLLG